jgi:NADPH-dependent 2,4-dienoyl-CoA reductase/sulfur reductase-like enzyme
VCLLSKIWIINYLNIYNMKSIFFYLFLLFAMSTVAQTAVYDVVVYGGTPAGVIATVAAAREGANVLLIEQTKHVGGMNTSGIGTAESEHLIEETISSLPIILPKFRTGT